MSSRACVSALLALDGLRIPGYEVLIRGLETGSLHTPDQFFSVARAARQLASLEFSYRESSSCKFVESGLPGK